MKHAIVFGSSGGIGRAMIKTLLERHDDIKIFVPSRNGFDPTDYHLSDQQDLVPLSWDSNDETSLENIATTLKESNISVDVCISAIGALHTDEIKPEKKLGQLTSDHMQWYFHVNAILHALIIKYISPIMNRSEPSFMGHLTARVGSISDNKLGGWYSYRAAKAALHMIIKTAAIEMTRYNKQLTIVGIHPGSVDTNLSKPFQSYIPD